MKRRKAALWAILPVLCIFLALKPVYAINIDGWTVKSLSETVANQLKSEFEGYWAFIRKILNISVQQARDEGEIASPYFLVTKVVDGDTIDVSTPEGVKRVRLLGIDTPETKDPRKPVQCFGEEAARKTSEMVDGKYVRLESDPTQSDKDQYGRLLRYVYLKDGTFVNAELVKQGYAFSYKQYPTQKLEEFNQLEKQAREQNLGLWASCPVQ